MLSKMLKNSLILAMACSMSVPVLAADVSARVNGRVRTWLESVAVKDSTNTMQIKADGRLGASVSAASGSWTVTVFQDMDLDSDDGEASPTIGEQKITLENDSMDITLGHFSPYGVSKGMAYAIGPVSDDASYWVGENVPTADVTDHLTIGLKDVGLTVIVGLNNYHDADSTTDARNETVIGAVYGKQFGAVDLGVQYLSVGSKVDDEDSNGTVNGSEDGRAFSALALGVGYTISNTLGVTVNYESNSNTSGISGAEADKNSIMELWLDVGLDNTSGISVGYASKTNDDGSANKGQSTLISLSYLKQLGIASLYANYLTATEKDDDTALDTSTTVVAVGMQVDF